jgi:site-specific recombinase XerC
MTLLAPTLEMFFCERLMTQREASPHTIAGYRDTMRLLLTFANTQTGKPPSKLEIDDLDAELITRFLTTSSTTAATPPEPGTCASRRSTRSTDTPRSGTPNTPP